MNTKHLASICVLLALACASRAGETIRVASVSPLSGSQAGLGEMVKLGAQLAVDEAKPRFAELGIDLQFTPQDDQAQPDVGVAVARRLVNDASLLGIVGHFNSGVAIPSSEVYKDFNLVMVSPANTNPRVTERRYGNVNRVCGRDDVQGPVGAEFAIKDLGAKKIFVMHDKTAYGQGVAEAFRDRAKELGAEVVGFVGTEEKSNFQTIILQLKVLNPDFVYAGCIYDQAGVLLKQMREKGIAAKFLGPDGLDSSEFVKIAQDAAVGAYYTSCAGPIDQYPAAGQFAKAFESKFKKLPESYALYSYDAANVVLAALESVIKAGNGAVPSRQAVCEAVRKVDQDGITGHIAFDDKGDRKVADYFVVQYKEAKYPGTMQKVISAAAP
ncbi:MAG TPA: branched-chain amino acid ABC transporter substrate-binding protein [Kiritimatiellia bacterium]|jgi:branched-chain amino acid transport system substrate-binding protein